MSLFDYTEREQEQNTLAQPKPLTVSELTWQIKSVLEEMFSEIWVQGEISNLSRPRSGHLYLTLKDDGAQLPAVLWKTVASKIRYDLKDGMEVLCRGHLEVYPPQGKYQMIVSQLEPKGVGALELAFRQLHAKLSAEGLFAPARKKAIPSWIKTVAVITSPSGAALRDFLQVLHRRTRRVDVRIVPVKVQGEGSAKEIAAAIALVNRVRLADCMVITRGGGSLEDLWAFNEEVLVRAVSDSHIPTISAVGHEVDITLCDLAADLRTLTPSEAAERIAPEDALLLERLVQTRCLLEDSLSRRMRLATEQLRYFANQPVLTKPMRLIQDRSKTVDVLDELLDRRMQRKIEQCEGELTKWTAALEALSPLAVLSRGYSLTQKNNGRVVRSIQEVQVGAILQTRIADGILESKVNALMPKAMDDLSPGVKETAGEYTKTTE